MELVNKLLELRKSNGFSQEELAEKLGVSRQTISKWELNESSPDLKQAKQLSKIFNVSLDELANNDIKDILTKKISNVEKLSGFIHKLLVGILICAIIFVLLFIVDTLTRVSGRGTIMQLHFCSLNNQSYEIKISAESEEEIGSLIRPNRVQILDDNMPITKVEVNPFIAIPDLEKYDKFYQVKNLIFHFFESKGGSCY
jgi:transcriptional regulator with XRE-family HTH domain